jgi:hypothetical protein
VPQLGQHLRQLGRRGRHALFCLVVGGRWEGWIYRRSHLFAAAAAPPPTFLLRRRRRTHTRRRARIPLLPPTLCTANRVQDIRVTESSHRSGRHLALLKATGAERCRDHTESHTRRDLSRVFVMSPR